jgi:hypothetical protein
VGQEETAGESSVSVVAGVRTVTTNMDGRDVLPRLSRPFAFSAALFNSNFNHTTAFANIRNGFFAALRNARFCKLEYTLKRGSASPVCLIRGKEFGHCRGCKFAQKHDRTNTK